MTIINVTYFIIPEDLKKTPKDGTGFYFLNDYKEVGISIWF